MKQEMKKARMSEQDMTDEFRTEVITTLFDFPPKMKPPGIRAIKKKELSQKYRSLVPPEYCSLDLYEDPTEEELAMLKEQEKDKRAAKAAKKKKSPLKRKTPGT